MPSYIARFDALVKLKCKVKGIEEDQIKLIELITLMNDAVFSPHSNVNILGGEVSR